MLISFSQMIMLWCSSIHSGQQNRLIKEKTPNMIAIFLSHFALEHYIQKNKIVLSDNPRYKIAS